MITALTDSEGERHDVLRAFRRALDRQTPFQVLVQGQITDWYPSGWEGAPVLSLQPPPPRTGEPS